MLTWDPLYGTGARGLQGLAACRCNNQLGFWDTLYDAAATGVDFSSDAFATSFVDYGADWASYMPSLADVALPTVDASMMDPSFIAPDASAFVDTPPVDASALTDTPISGDYIPADATTPDFGPTEYAQEADSVAVAASDASSSIGDILKTVGGGAASLLKMVLQNAPGAIQAATKLMTTQAQIQTAQAALQRGQIPAGYAVTQRGQLVPPGYTVNTAGQLVPQSMFTGITRAISANPLPFAIGGAALLYLLTKKGK